VEAANQLTYKGVCATYHADSGGVLIHTASLAKWDPNAVEKTTVKLTFPPAGTKGSAATTGGGQPAGSTTSLPASTSTTAKP
jgi:hypothetical protein